MRGTTLKESSCSILKTFLPGFYQSFNSVYLLFQQSLLGPIFFSFNGRLAYTDHAKAITISRTAPTVNAAPVRSLAQERQPKDRGASWFYFLLFFIEKQCFAKRLLRDASLVMYNKMMFSSSNVFFEWVDQF